MTGFRPPSLENYECIAALVVIGRTSVPNRVLKSPRQSKGILPAALSLFSLVMCLCFLPDLESEPPNNILLSAHPRPSACDNESSHPPPSFLYVLFGLFCAPPPFGVRQRSPSSLSNSSLIRPASPLPQLLAHQLLFHSASQMLRTSFLSPATPGLSDGTPLT